MIKPEVWSNQARHLREQLQHELGTNVLALPEKKKTADILLFLREFLAYIQQIWYLNKCKLPQYWNFVYIYIYLLKASLSYTYDLLGRMLYKCAPNADVGNCFAITTQFTISDDSKLGRLILKFT